MDYFFWLLVMSPGGSENVNYAVHVFMALLVQSRMFEEVICNRLPVG